MEHRESEPSKRIERQSPDSTLSRQTLTIQILEDLKKNDSLDEKIAAGEIDHQALFDAISQHPLFVVTKKPLLAKDPKSPIIILLEDKHGSPKLDYRKITFLQETYNINFVGLEGWAGHQTDKERGHRYLNAEEETIAALIDDKKFQTIPLENPEQQIDTLKTVIAIYTIYIWLYTELKDHFGLDKHKEATYENYGYNLDILMKKFKKLLPGGITNLDKLAQEYQERLEIDFDKMRVQPGESKDEYYRRVYIQQIKLHKNLDKITNEPRSITGAKLFTKSLKTNKRHIGVMLFGSAHSQKLVEELQKNLGDCTILRFSSEEPEELPPIEEVNPINHNAA